MKSEGLNLDLIVQDGAIWLGSMPVEADSWLHFYLPADHPEKPLNALLGAFSRACTPLPLKETTRGLASMMTLCKIRAMDDDEIHLTLSLFKDKLAEYPADAVIWAISEWPERNTFFPSWHELKELVLAHCWARIMVRHRLAEVLQNRRRKM